MTRPERVILISIALAMTGAAALFVLHPPEIGASPPPGDPRILAPRVARHPTDWEAASALTEVSLDARVRNPPALWRAAYAHAAMLAPERLDPANAFARAAFFHWPELSERERRDALTAFAPLLRRPFTFGRMAKPLFDLTGDLSILRNAHPPTEDAIRLLIAIAVTSGRFADYRALRTDLTRQRLEGFALRRNTATPEELITQFPVPPYHADSEPLMTRLLEELHNRPLTNNPGSLPTVEGVLDYSLRHSLRPLDGLEAIARTPGAASNERRLQLAQQLKMTTLAKQLEGFNDPRRVRPNESEWQDLCGTEVCYHGWRMIDAAHGVAVTVSPIEIDSVPAYVEIYIDDALRAEGEAAAKATFVAAVGSPGRHRVEVLLANATTRNGRPRRIHIESITTL